MANPVFISYRRSDTTGEAGRLADALESLLGAACVFRDADDIPAGEDFEVVLKRELAETGVVVVLIGKQWLTELTRRHTRPEPDFVRIEIATALRLGKRVIPVLLQGAELPSFGSLPEELRTLVNRQALSLRDEAWIQDAGRLADAIGRPYAWRNVALRALLFIVATVISTKYAIGTLAPNATNQIEVARGVIFGALALYAGVEWFLWWKRKRKGS
ncbi:MAG: toll/interleukin-1 receptor domain-containing protein [Betaproteobacteria bacterium]|nr:toll/interleukin-1 receptor domain-containing protein [Betaproteobacteria bacterium]